MGRQRVAESFISKELGGRESIHKDCCQAMHVCVWFLLQYWAFRLSEISVSPSDRRKLSASRPGRASYSDPNKKVNKYFVLHPTATFPFATPAFPWVNTFGNK